MPTSYLAREPSAIPNLNVRQSCCCVRVRGMPFFLIFLYRPGGQKVRFCFFQRTPWPHSQRHGASFWACKRIRSTPEDVYLHYYSIGFYISLCFVSLYLFPNASLSSLAIHVAVVILSHDPSVYCFLPSFLPSFFPFFQSFPLSFGPFPFFVLSFFLSRNLLFVPGLLAGVPFRIQYD